MSARLDRLPNLVEALAAGELLIWRVGLELDDAAVAELAQVLSAEELVRADRFYFPRDRRRFIAARASLRNILAGVLGAVPRSIVFSYNVFGKPALADGMNREIRFNVSHSQEVALVAVAKGGSLGIDIEAVNRDVPLLEIAERFFSQKERSALRSVPRDFQAEAFFDCWVCKEAYIKARGMGLSLPLESFSLPVLPGERCSLVSEDSEGVRHWSVAGIPCDEGFRAAIAVEGEMLPWRLLRWETGAGAGEEGVL